MLKSSAADRSRISREIISRVFLFLILILAACNPGAESKFATPNLNPSQLPVQSLVPSPKDRKMLPTAISTPTWTVIPPSPTFLASVIPVTPSSPAVIHPTATYICPWADMAQSTPVYTYQVVNSFHHDPAAYTQGLIYRDGVLYEGTGLRGESTLRKVTLESGEVEQSIELPQQYFGEGITELSDKIYQLTWQEQTGFIYDKATFNQLATFSYPTEGWGLTHDGKNLIMSDGTPNLYFLDPQTLLVNGQVTVTSENIPVPRLNELEYIDGEVWANIYQTSCIARINPSNGQVVGWIDITGILSPEDQPGSEVPNGIAYDSAGDRIFVTGKQWPKLFEIIVKPAGN
jgi:glutaminyl-peptide cyclotransferase